jgi:ABC-type transport system involved in cytochrome c biogenesis permease component
LKGILLPVLLFPLSFPLFFAAIELSMGLVTGGGLPASSPWLSLLVGLDVLYFVLGLNLIAYVVRD